MLKTLISCTILIAILPGCFATYATGPKFAEVSAPPAGKALLYVYQVNTPLQSTPTIKIDGVAWVVLNKMGYSYAYVGTGVHRLMVDYGWAKSDNMFAELAINEGQIIFVRIYNGGFHDRIDEVPKQVALEQMSEYRYVEPIRMDF